MTRTGGLENKFLFDQLLEQISPIESSFGQPLEWLRLDDKKHLEFSYEKSLMGTIENNGKR